jgi:hypothetical protein
MTTMTKTEAARLVKIEALVAAVNIPNVTLSVGIRCGVRLFIRRHDIYGTTYRGDRYIIRRGSQDSVFLGGIEMPLAFFKARLTDAVEAIKTN